MCIWPPNTDLVYMALPRDVCITVVISLYRVIGVAVYPLYHYKRYRVVPCKLNLHFKVFCLWCFLLMRLFCVILWPWPFTLNKNRHLPLSWWSIVPIRMILDLKVHSVPCLQRFPTMWQYDLELWPL